jgi:DNA replication licensing factor MCM6
MDTGNQGRRGNGSSRRGNAGLSLNPGEKVELLVDTTAEAVKSRFLQFLCGYGQEELPPTTTMNTNNTDNNKEEEEEEEQQQQLIRPSVNYSQQAEVMRNTETSSLFVDFSHVLEYDPDLAQAIQAQYYRFEPFLRRAVFEFIRMEDVAYTVNEDANKSQREFFVCFYNFQHVSQ